MNVSTSEIILTILALIVGSWITIRYNIPLLLEWLDCMCIDDTTVRKERKDE